jgi:hypothetical protein
MASGGLPALVEMCSLCATKMKIVGGGALALMLLKNQD